MKIHNLKIEQEKITLADAVLNGFSKEQKKISSMFFYDDIGSVLFQKITQQAEYYLTNAEHEILSNYSDEIVKQMASSEIDLIELGVGDGHKTKIILAAFEKAKVKVNFYPIDISEKAIELLKNYTQESDILNIEAVVADYESGVKYISKLSTKPKLLLFLGSNIGNFNPVNGRKILANISNDLNKNDKMLIGFDLKKDKEVLTAAYNDAAGVTKDFNLNLLKRMNKELGANFDVNYFQHKGVYNESLGAMESFLISSKEQTVEFAKLKQSFIFKQDEAIHLEYSYKYSKEDIAELAEATGFEITKHYIDEKAYFIDSLWQRF